MKKIELPEVEKNTLSQFGRDGGQSALVVKKVLQHAVDELMDIRNIDSKGNMGLQALAHQRAAEVLVEIFKEIFPDFDQAPDRNRGGKPGDPPISPWR